MIRPLPSLRRVAVLLLLAAPALFGQQTFQIQQIAPASAAAGSPALPAALTLNVQNGVLVTNTAAISFDGGAFTPVPSTVTLLTPSFAGTRSGSIVLRYLLGWAPNGTNPYTPPAASGPATFSLPVVLTLQQGQP